MMTTDWEAVVNDPQVDIVAELAGGTGVARTMILTALKLGKPVITANKALLSAHGENFFAAANEHGTNLYYEASVCGGIPIIKSVREGFVGNRITHLYGIVNGTCIISHADEARRNRVRPGLKDARPKVMPRRTLRWTWTDTMRFTKLAFWPPWPRVLGKAGEYTCRRNSFDYQTDIRFANQLGYTIKLLGIIKTADGRPSPGRGAGLQRVKSPGVRLEDKRAIRRRATGRECR